MLSVTLREGGMRMEYFAMLALIIVLATGYIIVASKAADSSDKGNKK